MASGAHFASSPWGSSGQGVAVIDGPHPPRFARSPLPVPGRDDDAQYFKRSGLKSIKESPIPPRSREGGPAKPEISRESGLVSGSHKGRWVGSASTTSRSRSTHDG